MAIRYQGGKVVRVRTKPKSSSTRVTTSTRAGTTIAQGLTVGSVSPERLAQLKAQLASQTPSKTKRSSSSSSSPLRPSQTPPLRPGESVQISPGVFKGPSTSQQLTSGRLQLAGMGQDQARSLTGGEQVTGTTPTQTPTPPSSIPLPPVPSLSSLGGDVIRFGSPAYILQQKVLEKKAELAAEEQFVGPINKRTDFTGAILSTGFGKTKAGRALQSFRDKTEGMGLTETLQNLPGIEKLYAEEKRIDAAAQAKQAAEIKLRTEGKTTILEREASEELTKQMEGIQPLLAASVIGKRDTLQAQVDAKTLTVAEANIRLDKFTSDTEKTAQSVSDQLATHIIDTKMTELTDFTKRIGGDFFIGAGKKRKKISSKNLLMSEIKTGALAAASAAGNFALLPFTAVELASKVPKITGAKILAAPALIGAGIKAQWQFNPVGFITGTATTFALSYGVGKIAGLSKQATISKAATKALKTAKFSTQRLISKGGVIKDLTKSTIKFQTGAPSTKIGKMFFDVAQRKDFVMNVKSTSLITKLASGKASAIGTGARFTIKGPKGLVIKGGLGGRGILDVGGGKIGTNILVEAGKDKFVLSKGGIFLEPTKKIGKLQFTSGRIVTKVIGKVKGAKATKLLQRPIIIDDIITGRGTPFATVTKVTKKARPTTVKGFETRELLRGSGINKDLALRLGLIAKGAPKKLFAGRKAQIALGPGSGGPGDIGALFKPDETIITRITRAGKTTRAPGVGSSQAVSRQALGAGIKQLSIKTGRGVALKLGSMLAPIGLGAGLTRPKLVPGIGTKGLSISQALTLPTAQSITMQAPTARVSSVIDTGTRSVTQPISVVDFISPTILPITPPILPRFIFIPGLDTGGGGGGRGRRKRRIPKRPTKYMPSLVAASRKIYGRPQKILTGMELRPIPMRI